VSPCEPRARRSAKPAPRLADRIREGLLETIAFESGELTGAKVHRVRITCDAKRTGRK
jgi:hypothetical protein